MRASQRFEGFAHWHLLCIGLQCPRSMANVVSGVKVVTSASNGTDPLRGGEKWSAPSLALVGR